MTPEQQLEAKFREYMGDAIPFFRDCLTIRDHDTASLLPFKLNKGQRILHAIAEKQKADRGKVRVLLLKSRRFGGSTYVEARSYWNTSLKFNRNTFIVGHEEESTKTLFGMAKLFQERNPIAPSILASNAQELKFDTKDGKGLKSEYRLATARNLTAGRSQGIHYLHISEEAFWPDGGEELLLGLFQCVPDSAETEIFRESTANGYGDTFQEAVNKAFCEGVYPYYEEGGQIYAWHNPKSEWVLVFIPWFAIEKYTVGFDSDDQRAQFEKALGQKVFDPETLKWVESEGSRLRRKFNVSMEQLHWREYAIENKCNGSLDKFHQEYPSTVEEAFLSQGSNVFSKSLCDHLEEQCIDPLIVGDVSRSVGRTRIKRNRHGAFRVWETAKAEDSYFITVDVAGGISDAKVGKKRAKDDEPDKTNIEVWNHRTGAQAAQWNGHIDYDMVADLIGMIGDLYALDVAGKPELPTACVELNNHGFTVVAGLSEMKYPQYGTGPNGQPGWMTNKRTKPQMVDGLREAARDGSLKINCVQTVGEMRTYIEEGGKFAAASGCNDDRVITAAIASQMLSALPRKFNESRRTRKTQVGFSNFKKRQEAPQTSSYEEYYT